MVSRNWFNQEYRSRMDFAANNPTIELQEALDKSFIKIPINWRKKKKILKKFLKTVKIS